MRKKDEQKDNLIEKAAKTINFDKIVLLKLEERARKSGITVSKLVNFLVRDKVMTDSEYFREMGKKHYLKWKECQYMAEQCEVRIEVERC
jgi:macrodomain Ter protein organizer (MatP/YcbG family)